jgi:hypothetical protein
MHAAVRQFLRLAPPGATLLVLAAGGLPRVAAQDLPWGSEEEVVSPYGLKLEYVRLDVEGQGSSYRVTGQPRQDWSQVTLMPAVGVKWDSYIYSPFLLNYSFILEPGYFWQRGNSAGRPLRVRQWMLNGRAAATFLSAKPYATSLAVGRSRQQLQSNFFNSQTVDLRTWSVHSGYAAGAVPVSVGIDHSNEDRSGGNQDFVIDQLRINVHAANDRRNQDATVLDYQYNRYKYITGVGASSVLGKSDSHHALLTDREIFKNGSLYSSLNFNTIETGSISATNLTGAINYNRELAANLHGTASYTMSSSAGNGYDAVQHNLVTAINHQLYESLGSHLDLHGLKSDNHSTGAAFGSSTYGLTGSVGYTKRLGAWGSLSVNNSATFDRSAQSSTGDVLVIPSESYAIPAAGPMIIRLKSPRVVSITSVTKNNVPLDADEWRVLAGSDPWQIEFTGGGVHAVTNGDTIVITYIVQPNPTGRYTTTNYTTGVMLRCWHDQLGVRLNYQNTTNHTAAAGLVLQDLRQYQVGADAGWHGLKADASYTHERSTLYAFQSRALSESYSVPVSPSSTVGVTLNQQWINYPAGSGSSTQQAQDFSYYNYLLHYDWHPGGGLSLNAEGGLQRQRGSLVDQNLLAARVHLTWIRGKLEVHCGFEHENLEYVNDTYARNFIFVRMRRNF